MTVRTLAVCLSVALVAPIALAPVDAHAAPHALT